MDRAALAEIVGALPPNSAEGNWWGNTMARSQARAWLSTGRSVRVDGDRIIFSRVGPLPEYRPRPRSAERSTLGNGVAALAGFARRAGYPSVASAVAAHTIFIPPDTVRQTGEQAVFPVIRGPVAGKTVRPLGTSGDGRPVLLDDNTTPVLAFVWAAGYPRTGPDVQVNHIWTDSKNPDRYTALWNLCATPAFLAKTTDGQNHPDVRDILMYRAFELYGVCPDGHAPARPDGYESLSWASMPRATADLESTYRQRLESRPKCPPAQAARQIGWLFSAGRPDTSIGRA